MSIRETRLFCALASLVATSAAMGQGLIVHAMTGQPVVRGLPGEMYSSFPNVSWGGSERTIPRINNGHIVFRAGTSAGAPILVGQPGSPAVSLRLFGETGMPGVQFVPLEYWRTNPSTRVTSSGEIGVMVKFQGAGITTLNDEAYFTGQPGQWRVSVREGAEAPEHTTGATYHGEFVSADWFPMAARWQLSNSGRSVVFSHLTRPPVTLGVDWGMVSEHAGQASLVARGNFGPWGTGTPVGGWPLHQFRGTASVNDFGTVAFHAQFDAHSIEGQPLGLAVVQEGGRQLAVRDGDPAPGVPGAHLQLSVINGMPGHGGPGLNNAGGVTTSVNIRSGANQTIGTGILKMSANIAHFVAKTGDPKPGGGTFGVNDLLESRTILSGSDAVAFADQTRRGVFVGTSIDNLRLAFDPSSAVWPAGLGQPLVITDTIGMNAADQLAAAFAFPTSPTTTAIAGWDPVAGNMLIAYTGQTIEVQPGIIRTIASLDINGMDGVFSGGGEDGRPNSLDSAGRIVFTAHFTNNESAVLVATIPAPTAGVVVGIGMLAYARRRR